MNTNQGGWRRYVPPLRRGDKITVIGGGIYNHNDVTIDCILLGVIEGVYFLNIVNILYSLIKIVSKVKIRKMNKAVVALFSLIALVVIVQSQPLRYRGRRKMGGHSRPCLTMMVTMMMMSP
ncbi:jg2499, partial [Pararge aegeria aegeria]